MAEIEHVKRAKVGRPNRLTSSDTKREKSENDAKCNRSRINIGEEFGRCTDLKTRFRLKTRAEVGTILLDRYAYYKKSYLARTCLSTILQPVRLSLLCF